MKSVQRLTGKHVFRITARRIMLCVLILTTVIVSAQCVSAPVNVTENTTIAPFVSSQVTRGWSDTSSTATELSFSYPGDWFGPARLPFGDGVYIKHPDESTGMIFQIGLQGQPDEMLKEWGKEPVEIVGLLKMTPNKSETGQNIVVSRIETGTREATDGNVIAQCSYIARENDVLQIIRFAPEPKWGDLEKTFTDVLASVEIWNKLKIDPLNLQTMVLHDWPAQAATVQEGIIFLSPDGNSAFAVWTRDIADPVELLGAWKPDIINKWGFTDVSSPVNAERFSGLGGDWEAMSGSCKKPDGTALTYAVSMIPDGDRVLEIVIYGPAADWEKTWSVFKVMLGVLTDLRPR